jgi:hypothetical protein
MSERNQIEKVIERAVSKVLESHVPRLRDELVQRVLQELQPQLAGASGASSGASLNDLLTAISGVHAGTTQREILRALLEGATRYCGRTALFVVKAGAATGWQARGFADSDSIKDFSLDVNGGLGARALRDRTRASGNASEMDARFIEQFGKSAGEQVHVLPLMLKDKVAALVYADGGVDADGHADPTALEVLVIATSAWLEVVSLRKQSQREGTTEAAEKMEAPAPVAAQPVPSVMDPFAAHAPMHAVHAEVPAAVARVSAHEEVPVEDTPVTEAAMSAAAGASTAAPSDALSNMPPDDAEVHRKAQRFAKLLVDEIKLYNQAKVTEGRKKKDLYDRLKEEIEKSRSTFQKRYGNTVAASGNYFQNEIVRSLAEDDLSIMGANFRR